MVEEDESEKELLLVVELLLDKLEEDELEVEDELELKEEDELEEDDDEVELDDELEKKYSTSLIVCSTW